ncbi:hypothetical protein [Streptomyces sp. TBY4]|uniref:hypothetical protein n=1 Tax=Streptomyces sp. TBY4 TaxID=2962030 RepID=UPI0035AEDC87
MRLVPFEKVVPDDLKIDNLAGEKDLTGPAPVRIATNAYAETEDRTGRRQQGPQNRPLGTPRAASGRPSRIPGQVVVAP